MKQYSAKKSIQILGYLLREYGINKIIISPGSRNAPLAIHFSKSDEFQCYSIVDERSAGFVGMGMAKSLKKPVALSCTSGSATVNYYPAIVEAFYQNIPLLILTADRPSDMIDIFDGQTIRQKNIFQQHSYGNFSLLEDNIEKAEEYNFYTIKTALETCIEKQGPVHINIPLKEPLYEYIYHLPNFPSVKKRKYQTKYDLPSPMISEWNLAKKILILTGTLDKNTELEDRLCQLLKNHSCVILTESNSNLKNDSFFSHIDRYIHDFSNKDFTKYSPDLLITIGQNVVSKKVKEFLRTYKPQKHWHIDTYWHPDTYYCLSKKINTKPELFFTQLLSKIDPKPSPYYLLWNNLKEKKDQKHKEFIQKAPFSDFTIFNLLKDAIPDGYNIHFSNSSSIRYAQLFNFKKNSSIYCNRGTSGIDGCTSTAMGFAIANNTPTVLITGDLSFFYDINGLWNKYIPPHTRIIIINNGGGNIFKIIPGPSSANAIDEFIVTTHNRNAKELAKAFGFNYFQTNEQNSLEKILKKFFKPSKKAQILEFNTSKIDNAQVLKDYFNFLKL